MRGSGIRRLGLLVAALFTIDGALSRLEAQQVIVRGTVFADTTQEPIASVSVVVKGTSTGTQTDANGAFTLRVPNANATLVVSRIGFARQEVPLNGRTTVAIRMTATAVSLSEVVVVGYGTQKRSDITGAGTSVPAAQLEEKPNTNSAQAREF